jgi:porphobilinogen deaminase
VTGETIALSGVMLSVDGSQSVRAVHKGDDAESLGRSLARHLRDEMGGAALAGWQRTT